MIAIQINFNKLQLYGTKGSSVITFTYSNNGNRTAKGGSEDRQAMAICNVSIEFP